jgi:NAD(P)-dependent dehydrogenase (short-subunit alcohol dehydrogenase family)
MPASQKVAIITGASQGIGAGLVAAFRHAGYAVVGASRSIRPSDESGYLTYQPRKSSSAVLTSSA